MFQYAAGRALAMRNRAELVLDTWSGFVRDNQYRRRYELGGLPIRARRAQSIQQIPYWLYWLGTKFRAPSRSVLQPGVFGQFLVENAAEFLPEVAETPINRNSWLIGYWQSPRYFDDCIATLQKELMPPTPRELAYQEIGEAARGSDSVALAIRLYEESPDPTLQARDGKLKRTDDINHAIHRLRLRRPTARFFVFCTHRSPLLEELTLPNDCVFVTGDDGYRGTLQTLWLLTQCRHHIFTNSSYYWWGAWLSHAQHAETEQVVYAADNFINRDSLCAGWETF